MMHRSLAMLVATALFAAACSSSGTGPNDNGNNGNNGNGNTATGTMTATVGGRAFSATLLTTATQANSVVIVQGEAPGGSAYTYNLITIAIGGFSGPGTFSLAPGNPNGANAGWSASSAAWSSALTGGSGTITVTAYNATHIAGTFSFTAISAAGSANVVVTSGKFDIPF